MCKRAICLVSLCLVLGVTSVAPAKLVAHWKLDDGSGTTAIDSSGNGFNGTLIGGPTWVTGTDGGALQFDGLNDYVDFGNPATWPAGKSPRTLCGWGKANSVSAGYRWMAAYGSPVTSQAMFIGMNGSTLVVGGYGGDDVTVANTWRAGEWQHLAVTYDGTTAKAYLNGLEIGSMTKNWNLVLSRAHIGRQVNDYAEFWNGAVDDVRLYDHALKAAEVKALIPPKLKARNPSPADGASDVGTIAVFTWISGETAVSEDVYFGTTPDLTEADRVVYRQPAFYKFYMPKDPLVPGQKYYWRVDAVEADGTVHEGDVWSFFVTPETAWAPNPGNGAAYIDPETALEWSPGLNAFGHDLYFGTDRADVEAGTGDTAKATNQSTTSYEPGPLARGVTYYWRIDEVLSGGGRLTGEVWSFTTRPIIAKADPNLVGWWKLDDENSGTAVDYSGWDTYGEIRGGATWVEGCYGDALQFDGDNDYVDFGNPTHLPSGTSPRSMCAWAKTDSIAFGWRWIAAYGSPGTGNAMFIGTNGTDLYGGGYGDDVFRVSFWEPDVWHHICLTYDGTTARLYADGVEVTWAPKDWNLALGRAHIGRQVNDYVEFWDGTVDDVRIYNKALTLEEVAQAMRGDPLLAWNPQPKVKANVDIRDASTLSWSPGETAAQHDVYLGTDKAAVKAADMTSPEYRGRQTDTSIVSAGLVVFGGGSYFWRVDEVEADGTTVHKGSVWEFTVPDYLIVDEFEDYTNNSPYRVFQTWIDGWGFSIDDFFPTGNPGNGTGALVGYDPTLGDIMETLIVHGGRQSMPMEYNNVNSPYYSETERTWEDPQDWTLDGVTDLSLWFRGNPVAFADNGSVITMSASGTDIWNNADQLRFAYKQLNGDGSMTVKVNSLKMTDGWAKAGVMIRQTLDAESAHAATVVTPSNGVSFPWRAFTGDASNQVNQTGPTIKAPYWVRITRTGNTFKAEHSADGNTWSIIGADATLSQHDIVMSASVYIGLCLTSHNTADITTAEFSDIKTTGNVTGTWQVAEIGADHPGNDPATLYVVLQDNGGKFAVVENPDANATVTSEWTQWRIPLSQFTNVNARTIKKMSIGVGNRNTPSADGTGKLYIDDIHVIKP
jgi:regulation of enolase protein 1 (concanavalin A-like superfamily)